MYNVANVRKVGKSRYTSMYVKRNYKYYIYGKVGNAYASIVSKSKPLPNLIKVNIISESGIMQKGFFPIPDDVTWKYNYTV